MAASPAGPGPAMATRSAAASSTVRAIGPAVSWLGAMGTIPSWLIKPWLGLMPTRLWRTEGLMIEPSVSVPIPTGAISRATAAPVPLLEPLGVAARSYGLRTWPPSEE